jgi:hypothetical protein
LAKKKNSNPDEIDITMFEWVAAGDKSPAAAAVTRAVAAWSTTGTANAMTPP